MTASLVAGTHQLAATPATVHWGYFDRTLAPVLTVASGSLVSLEAVTHHAGDAPDLLMDDAIAALYRDVADRGPGPHILTGPVEVEGAEPGDVLEVRVLSLEPRLGYGSNLAAHWGHLYRDFAKERVTIWSIDPSGNSARAVFAFDWVTTPLADVPGTVVDPASVPRLPVGLRSPVEIRPHLGTIGCAPAAPGRHSSVPPGRTGGNIDNWRAGPGTSMYYPVECPGALVSFGDPHCAQGDGEISGTALEASLNVVVELRIHRGIPIETPVLETPTHWFVHGFGDSLDEAMRDASLLTLHFLLRRFDIAADDAYSLLSVGGDFGITQVVDGRVGVHCGMLKRMVGGEC
jgi:acetamidase/formamidase